MESAVEVRDLRKVYTRGANEVVALDDVSLDIAPGGFVALMGPSGSGKTTLLNIIAGVDEATSGRVTVEGTALQSLSESQKTAWRTRSMGYIFQFYNLLPVLTAWENVELPLLVLGLSKGERREHVEVALEAVGLTDRSKHYPRELSGGQEQRVAIARAIVTDARLLVADEPTGNLDAESEKEIMELLQRLNAEYGKTLIMVTHDAAAAAYAKRRVRLEKGRLIDAAGEETDHVR
jgi:putative ABC transport system ATP-binding protein